MTKIKWTWTLVILVTVALSATAIRHTMAQAQQDHSQHQMAAQTSAATKDSGPPPIADGDTNPGAIPDLVAYEFLLNSIAEGPALSEPERLRAKMLAEEMSSVRIGLAKEKVALVKETANKFKDDIKSFDAESKGLKDRNWPKPDQSIFGQLNALQQQKEASLRKAFNSLLGQLSDEDKEKLNKRLLEIKRSVKVYQDIPLEKFQKK